MSNSIITYSGKVNIKIVKDGTIIKDSTTHNQGNDPLFYFLCCCLLGSYVEANAPKYIKLIRKVGEDETLTPAIPIIKQSTPIKDTNDNYQVSFSSIVEGSIIGNNTKVIGLNLYSQNNVTLDSSNGMATIMFSEPMETPLDANNTSMYVTWTMSFENKTE